MTGLSRHPRWRRSPCSTGMVSSGITSDPHPPLVFRFGGGLSFGCLFKLYYYYFFFFNFNFSQFKQGCFNLLKNANPPRNWYTLQFWKGPVFLPGFLAGCWGPTITQPGQTLWAAKTEEPWLRKTVRPTLSLRSMKGQHLQIPALCPALCWASREQRGNRWDEAFALKTAATTGELFVLII